MQTRLPKTKRVWPMKINVICTVPVLLWYGDLVFFIRMIRTKIVIICMCKIIITLFSRQNNCIIFVGLLHVPVSNFAFYQQFFFLSDR